jgi:hypothetical protein
MTTTTLPLPRTMVRSKLNPLVVLAGFMLCFLFPSLPLAGSFGLEPGHLAALATLLAVLFSRRKTLPFQSVWTYLALIVPSLFPILLDPTNLDNPASFNTAIFLALSLLSMLTVGRLVATDGRALLHGVALAVIVHALVGFLQVYSFSQGQFPLKGLYVNPSYSPVVFESYALYIKRPFGLMPEPSAMVACLSPWVLLLMAGGLRLYPLRVNPWLLWGAVGMGSGLMLLSLSGGVVWFVLGTGLLALLRLWQTARRSTVRGLTELLVGSVLVLGLLGLVYQALSGRLADEQSYGSLAWLGRLDSIITGWDMLVNSDLREALFGYGFSTTVYYIQDNANQSGLHSVVLNYVVSCGVVGLLALFGVLLSVVRGLWKAQGRGVLLVILAVWFCNLLMVTSYLGLIPVWTFLGWLMTAPNPEATEVQ